MVSLYRWDWHQVSQDTFPSANAFQTCSHLTVPTELFFFATIAKNGASFSLVIFLNLDLLCTCAEIHQTYFK